ncbi:MAG: pyridoxamine 5'-phosphate oxidase family protein [Bacteroidota bacterium]
METSNKTNQLDRAASLEKLRDVAHKQTAFLCTHTQPYEISARPMMTQQVTDEGKLLFFVGIDQDSVLQIKRQSQVSVLYHNGSDYLSLRGTARTYRNQEKIKELYTPVANAWFDGPNDPNLLLLEVNVEDAHYWGTENGTITTLYKMAKAAVTGEDADIGTSKELTV